MASAGETDLLITGDMDAAAERKLLEQWGFSDIEVLVAGHHGSKYSTSQELLEALEPADRVHQRRGELLRPPAPRLWDG